METPEGEARGLVSASARNPLLTWEVKAKPGPRGRAQGRAAGQGTPGRQMGRREGERDRGVLSVVTNRALSRIRVTGRPVHGAGRCHAGHGATGRHSKT